MTTTTTTPNTNTTTTNTSSNYYLSHEQPLLHHDYDYFYFCHFYLPQKLLLQVLLRLQGVRRVHGVAPEKGSTMRR